VEPFLSNVTTEEMEAAPQSAAEGHTVFDFTQPEEMMDPLTFSVYRRLSRAAKLAPGGEFKSDEGKGDASLLPDGKIYTEAEVIAILGPDYQKGLAVNPNCCG